MAENRMLDTTYWQNRTESIMQEGQKNALRMVTELKSLYTSATREIEKEIQAFYMRYAQESGMSYSTIKEKLTPSELLSVKQDITRYYEAVEKYGGYDPKYKAELRLLSGRAYMSRLEALKLQLEMHLEEMYREINIEFTERLSATYSDSYYRINYEIQKGLGVSPEFTSLNTRLVEAAVKQQWLERNFSDSLWEHKDALIKSLNTTFLQGVILGRNPNVIARQMAKEVMKKYDSKTKQNFVRLAVTEFSNIANQATMDGYKEYGVVEEYLYLATLAEGTCEVCGALDREHFPIDEAITGINYPPMHPNCRCTTMAYFKEYEIEKIEQKATRMATDPSTGKVYYVPFNTTYKEWRAGLQYTDGGKVQYVAG